MSAHLRLVHDADSAVRAEREHDRATLRARADHDRAMRALAPIRRPSVLPTIHLDNSLWARLVRAVQRFLPTTTKDKR